jgi:hypothetical protein
MIRQKQQRTSSSSQSRRDFRPYRILRTFADCFLVLRLAALAKSGALALDCASCEGGTKDDAGISVEFVRWGVSWLFSAGLAGFQQV